VALIVTIGGSDSQSMASVQEIESYLIFVYGALPASWSARSYTQKEFLAELSALAFGWLPLRGRRTYVSQKLAFPRDYQVDRGIIPDEVKKAQSLIAHEIMEPSLDDESDGIGTAASQAGVSGVSLGAFNASFGDIASLGGGGGSFAALIRSGFPIIYTLLQSHLLQVRGTRVRTTEEKMLDDESLLTTCTVEIVEAPPTTTTTVEEETTTSI
jgi:hypothetical protein